MLVVPALYAASDALLQRLNGFVKNGGHIVYTFKSGFSDENVKVRTSRQPGIIQEACGITYSQFTLPHQVSLKDDPYQVGKEQNQIRYWMELITPGTAKVLAYYDHPVWGSYAAITQNTYGKGVATYIGFMPGEVLLEKILGEAVKKAGLWKADQALSFPLITRSGVNQRGKVVHYYFNYSAAPATFQYPHPESRELLSNQAVPRNKPLSLKPWGVSIVEEN
jgi:beta-galactosidase